MAGPALPSTGPWGAHDASGKLLAPGAERRYLSELGRRLTSSDREPPLVSFS